MRFTKWAFLGVAVGVVFVVIVGVLSIQVIGRRAGMVFGLDNVPVGLTVPQVPFVPMLAIAAVSTLVMYSLTRLVRRNSRRSRVAFVAGFSVSTALLILLAFGIAPGVDTPRGELPLGVLAGWRGWIQEGGASPAVHVLLFLAIGSLWLYPSRGQAASSGGEHGEAEHTSEELTVSPSDAPDDAT